MLRSERTSAGDDGVSRGCTTLSGCSTPIECDATGRKSPQQDRSHKPRHEANGGAQCGKSARCVRRGGGWKRGAVETLRPKPARQSSTLPCRGSSVLPGRCGFHSEDPQRRPGDQVTLKVEVVEHG